MSTFADQYGIRTPSAVTLNGIGSAMDALSNGMTFYCGTLSGGTTAYTVYPATYPGGLLTGMRFVFKVNSTNTGAPTLNVWSTGAKNVYDFTGTALFAGAWTANYWYEVVYNGSEFIQVGEPSTAWTAWTPGFTGFSADPASGVYRYKRVGKMVSLELYMPNNGTSNATGFTITGVPFTSAASYNVLCVVQIVDNGNTSTTPGLISLGASSTTITCYKDCTGAAWTSSNGKRIVGATLVYEAA